MRTRAFIALAAATSVVAIVVSGAAAVDNGPKVAFTSTRGGSAVYSVGSDGIGEQRLTATERPAFEGEPSWSPDGNRIAYTCRNFELCVMDAGGAGQTRLTQTPWPSSFVYDLSPEWSPDGSRIVFSSNRGGGGRYDLWLVNIDGTGLARLGGTSGNDTDPTWSPDGSQIVFASTITGNGDLYVMNVDTGAVVRRLTAKPGTEDEPDWSPDGTRIVYALSGSEQTDLYVVNADGSGRRRLTKTPYEEAQPAWSPDGTQLLFASDPGHNWDIYASTLPGRRRLTTHPGLDVMPVWQPAPTTPQPPGSADPPPAATDDARVVASFVQWSHQLVADIEDLDASSNAVSLRSATALRKDGGRGSRALAALQPLSARGKKVRRLAMRSFSETSRMGREFEASYALLAGRHPLRALVHAFRALGFAIASDADSDAAGKLRAFRRSQRQTGSSGRLTPKPQTFSSTR